MRIFLALCAVAALSGCATQPLSFAKSRPVAANKIYNQGTGTAVVRIKRDSGFVGSACDTQISINGARRADIGAGEAVTLHAQTGRSIIGAEPTGMCGGNLKEVSADLTDGDTNKFRVSVDQTMSMTIAPTATE